MCAQIEPLIRPLFNAFTTGNPLWAKFYLKLVWGGILGLLKGLTSLGLEMEKMTKYSDVAFSPSATRNHAGCLAIGDDFSCPSCNNATSRTQHDSVRVLPRAHGVCGYHCTCHVCGRHCNRAPQELRRKNDDHKSWQPRDQPRQAKRRRVLLIV